MTVDGIPLSEAIEIFLGPTRWAAFVGHYPSREQAQKAIFAAANDPVGLALIREESASLLHSDGESALADIAWLEPARQLLREFEGQLVSGELLARGLREERWTEILIHHDLPGRPIFRLGADELKIRGHTYTGVRISAASTPKPEALIQRCGDWLKERRAAKGNEPKKILFEAARAEFGKELTTRAFNEAFRRVYGHARGRPTARPDK